MGNLFCTINTHKTQRGQRTQRGQSIDEHGSLINEEDGWRTSLEDTDHILKNLETTSLIVLAKYAPHVCHENLHDIDNYKLSTISYIAYKICYCSNSDNIQMYMKLYNDYIAKRLSKKT